MNIDLIDHLLCIAFLAFCLVGLWLTRKQRQD